MTGFACCQKDVLQFLTESNLIERIDRPPTEQELTATQSFLRLDKIHQRDLSNLVNVYAPGHRLRSIPGLNVRVGDYVAPPGGPAIAEHLAGLLKEVNQNLTGPWPAHVRYEMLHPFSDGNGHSGRALWAWHMLRDGQDPFALSFLHRFYYQTLGAAR